MRIILIHSSMSFKAEAEDADGHGGIAVLEEKAN
jgi:hypothetical protein